jgi:hypothetical protein
MSAVLAVRGVSNGPWTLPPLIRVGIAATLYALAVSAGFMAWHLWSMTQQSSMALAVSAAPTLLSAALAATSQHDRRQYCARLLAAMMMAPLGVLFWSMDGQLRLGGALALTLAFCVLHAAAFVLGLRWLAGCATRIEPLPAATPVAAGMLATRLVSMASIGPALEARATTTRNPCVRMAWTPTDQPGRTHVVTLRIDAERHEVTVLERLQADGAAPLDADEASMRAPGEPVLDASRPDAQRVWLRTVQTTMLDDERLAAAPVALAGDRVRWSGMESRTLADTDALMACLAAIVVRSGWTWQPRLNG